MNRLRMEIKKAKIEDIVPDNMNANQHTQYGMSLLEKSMREWGFVEPGVISEDNVICGGNARNEVAEDIGITEKQIIEIDGTKQVFVKLKGLKSGTKKFHELSIALNATGEKNLSWDNEVMEQIAKDFDINTEDWTGNIGIFEPLDYSDKNKEIDTGEFSDKMEMKFVLSSDEYKFIQKELAKFDESKENALLKLLNYES